MASSSADTPADGLSRLLRAAADGSVLVLGDANGALAERFFEAKARVVHALIEDDDARAAACERLVRPGTPLAFFGGALDDLEVAAREHADVLESRYDLVVLDVLPDRLDPPARRRVLQAAIRRCADALAMRAAAEDDIATLAAAGFSVEHTQASQGETLTVFRQKPGLMGLVLRGASPARSRARPRKRFLVVVQRHTPDSTLEAAGLALQERGHDMRVLALDASHGNPPRMISEQQAFSERWDAVLVEDAGFPGTTVQRLQVFRTGRFGTRIQHVLGDRSALDALRQLNRALRPDVVAYRSKSWSLAGDRSLLPARRHAYLEAGDGNWARYSKELVDLLVSRGPFSR